MGSLLSSVGFLWVQPFTIGPTDAAARLGRHRVALGVTRPYSRRIDSRRIDDHVPRTSRRGHSTRMHPPPEGEGGRLCHCRSYRMDPHYIPAPDAILTALDVARWLQLKNRKGELQ